MITHDISEAIYLSDRVLVLASRPAQLLGEVRVPLPRPRRRTHPMLGTLASDTMTLLERSGTPSSSPSHGGEFSDEADEATRHAHGEP
jgi:ABC-type nitrate/sulfonate/bicarbonate transport system ATPase subunit